MKKTLLHLAAGLVGGVAGTILIRQLMKAAPKLPERMRPPMPASDPGEVMVHKAEDTIGALPPRLRKVAVQGLQYGYGVLGPLALAALWSAIGPRSTGKTVLAGTALGALVWAAGYIGWLPAMNLVAPVHKVPISKTASGLMGHLAYGALASLPLAIAGPRIGG